MGLVKPIQIQLYTRPIPAYYAIMHEDGEIEMLGPYTPKSNVRSKTPNELYATACNYSRQIPEDFNQINEDELKSKPSSAESSAAKVQLNKTYSLERRFSRPMPTYCASVDEDGNIVKLGAFDLKSIRTGAAGNCPPPTAAPYSRPMPSQQMRIIEEGSLKALSGHFKNISICR